LKVVQQWLEACRYGTSSTSSFLLQRHPSIKDSLVGQVMTVEAASTLNSHTPVETLDYDLAMSTHTCVVPLFKGVATLRMKILRSTCGWLYARVVASHCHFGYPHFQKKKWFRTIFITFYVNQGA
jgi:hypothetical protein